MGKIRNPQYRIVVADSRTKRDGRAIEFLGIYHPREEPSRIEVDSERVQHWLSVGAQPSEPVIAILSKTGDWQKFKGLPPPAEPLRVAPARVDRTAAYEAQARAAAGLAEAETKARREAASARPAKATKATRPAEEAAGPQATGGKPAAAEPTAAAEATAAAAEATATPEATRIPEATAAPEAAGEESSGVGADTQA
jgi:small subunit ribosomal protein S16